MDLETGWNKHNRKWDQWLYVTICFILIKLTNSKILALLQVAQFPNVVLLNLITIKYSFRKESELKVGKS